MRNFNQKGFALVETLIVSVFVMGIFTLLYTNYYPLIGEYEKRENYDSIEAVYRTDVIKKFIKINGTTLTSSNLSTPKVYNSSNFCYFINDISKREECKQLWKNLRVNSIILTEYNITSAKTAIKNNSNVSQEMKGYVEYLPNYKTNTYNYHGRIIVEYKDVIDAVSEEKNYTVYKYATLGADLYD